MLSHTQTSVVDCPTCGRPIEISDHQLWQAMCCSHCGGDFVSYRRPNGTLGAATLRGRGSIRHAEHLLQTARNIEPTIAVVVESDDPIFRSVASGLVASGMRVLRAQTAVEAMAKCVQHDADLVVANVHLEDQSGWLLAAKLRWIDPSVSVWLYQTRWSDYERGLASFLQVDRMLDEDSPIRDVNGLKTRTVGGCEGPSDKTMSCRSRQRCCC